MKAAEPPAGREGLRGTPDRSERFKGSDRYDEDFGSWARTEKAHRVSPAPNTSTDARRSDGTATEDERTMVRRYDLKEGNDDEPTEMVERRNGDWVMADDYDALVEEAADLRKIIADAIDRLKDA